MLRLGWTPAKPHNSSVNWQSGTLWQSVYIDSSMITLFIPQAILLFNTQLTGLLFYTVFYCCVYVVCTWYAKSLVYEAYSIYDYKDSSIQVVRMWERNILSSYWFMTVLITASSCHPHSHLYPHPTKDIPIYNCCTNWYW